VEREKSRAVSPVIGTILLVAVVVILASVLSVFVFDVGQQLRSPGPTVSQSSGELVRNVPGGDDQTIRLTHEAGDSVTVSDIEIVVDATDACDARVRLVDLPTSRIRNENYEGDDIIDNRAVGIGGAIDTSEDGVWSSGDEIRFRLASSECNLASGDEVIVRIVHTPSNSVIVTQRLVAS
jgi:flagellin-like protein